MGGGAGGACLGRTKTLSLRSRYFLSGVLKVCQPFGCSGTDARPADSGGCK